MRLQKALCRIVILLPFAVMIACSGGKSNKVEAGSFTDPRDAQTYRTVKIGGSVWMAENLNYEPDTPYGESDWCYSNDEANCNRFGRLYDWQAASAACPDGWRLPTNDDWEKLIEATGDRRFAGGKLKSASGWRVTTYDKMIMPVASVLQESNDFLYYFFGAILFVGRALKLSGAGTDDFGFRALPSGYRYSDGSFVGIRNLGYWWSATESGAENGAESGAGQAYYRGIYYDRGSVDERIYYMSYGFSVRCVRADE